MRLEEEVRLAYQTHINEHTDENRKAALVVKGLVEHSPLFWNGWVDKTLQIPKVYSEESIAAFRKIAETSYGIFGKVIQEYLAHEDYRKLFPFSKELEELILLPAQYDGFLPIARFDLFYNEESGDFRFCEINTDGTAAMIRDLELGKALIENPAHQHVLQAFQLEQFELFDSWVESFLSLYESYPKKKAHPHIAIVDFLEEATPGDFREYARRFQKAGYLCEICDLRSLSYRDGKLYSGTGMRIDAIYRRAVTRDILQHMDEIGAFLAAVREDAVFFAGAFCTQIIHSKWLFNVLHLERTKSFLTEEENAFVAQHVPRTYAFAPGQISLEEVKSHKGRYMLKPMDSYASKGVYAAGHEYAQEAWDRLAEEQYGSGCICQEYCPQYLTENIDFAWGDGAWHPYLNMPGLYVYNGKFAGILCRMAEGETIITAHENERTVPAFVVRGRREGETA